MEDDRSDLSGQEDRASASEIDASDLYLNERSATPALVVVTVSATEQEEPASAT